MFRLSLAILPAAMQLHGAVTAYTDSAAFTAAAGPLRSVAFNSDPITSVPTNPWSLGGQQTQNYAGFCFQGVYNHYYLFIYAYPNAPLRVDLPSGTYAAGLDLAVFYGWSPADTPVPITVATTAGVQTFTWTRESSNFFGVISTDAIRWISVTHPLEYHIFLQLRVTASAGSVPSCPLPSDTLGPETSNVAIAPNPVSANTPIAVTADVSDAATGGSNIQSATMTINGSSPSAMTGTFGTVTMTSVNASLAGLAAAGVYDVCVSATDVVGNVGAPACTPLVVYDPSAGFVTGGGWFTSPAGAYSANPSVSGKASFGFVSKYAPGATVPTGNTQFVFHAANVSFRSTAYDWLVVAGARAQYKGQGAFNGEPGYDFLLTAIDGQLPGGGGADRLRLKIWNSTGVVYDNQLNAPDTAEPTTLLGWADEFAGKHIGSIERGISKAKFTGLLPRQPGIEIPSLSGQS